MMILNYMRPRLSLFNRCYLAWGYIEFTSYQSLSNSCRYLNSYLTDIIIGKLCKCSVSSSRMINKSMLNRVALIIRRRTPLKISLHIVSFATVNMIYLREFIRIFDKCHSNNSVRRCRKYFGIYCKCGAIVPSIANVLLKNFSLHSSYAFNPIRGNTFVLPWEGCNSTKIRGNMCFFITNNWLPDFIHICNYFMDYVMFQLYYYVGRITIYINTIERHSNVYI